MSTTIERPALGAWRKSVERAANKVSNDRVLLGEGLTAHLQPIVSLQQGAIIGYESLIRGPEGHALRSPDALLRAAREAGVVGAFEEVCVRVGLRDWAAQGACERLFVNLSASALVEMIDRISLDVSVGELKAVRVSPSALVVEITEHERVADLPRLLRAATQLRRLGVRFALDDFGDGHSSLRLWAELRPEFVKIDKYFIHSLHRESFKVQTLRGLMGFAEVFGTELIAEGVETEAELHTLRDLGIGLGQGYLLGRPAAQRALAIPDDAARVLASREVAVLPQAKRAAGNDFTIDRIVEHVPPLSPETTVDELARLFAGDPGLARVALVADRRPIGLVARQHFVDQYARPYFREVHGRKPCVLFANTSPLVLDRHTGVEGATAVLTSTDQRYLSDGFVITDGGRYLGLGTGQQLVRVVTELRIEAARHANPLTFLPGNIPISEHIARLLAACGQFVACYGDLNDFKPFNDHYGYWAGDEMIRLAARTIVAHCDPRRDFVGHVGGDDFVILFQSPDWHDRCLRLCDAFDQRALSLYDDAARSAGGIEAEDRHGVRRFFKPVTLSIGATVVPLGRFGTPEQVASAAAAAKSRAKHDSLRLVIEGLGEGSAGGSSAASAHGRGCDTPVDATPVR